MIFTPNKTSVLLTGLMLLGLSGPALLAPSHSLAATKYTQTKTADQLIQQFKAAGDDAAKMSEAITALQVNPKAVDKIMKGSDPALKKAFLKQDSLLRSQQVTGRWQSVREADALVQQAKTAMAGNDPVAKQQAIMNLLDNSEAVNRLNRHADPALKKAISKKIRSFQNETKALIRQRAATRLGVHPDQIVFVNTTHASAVPKVGQDWDLTIRIVDETVDPNTGKALRTIRDVKPHQVADIVQESFYQATTGKLPPTDAKALTEYRKAAALHSEAKSLELTWALHKEAIGGGIKEGSQLVKGKLPIRDAQQLSLVAEYKAQHPVAAEVKQIQKAARDELRALGLKPGDPKAQAILTRAEAQAHKLQVERARTYLKMFDKHIKPRVGHYGGKVPRQIEQANQILRQLADDTIDVGKASRQLGELGMSIDDVVYKSSGLVDAAKVLRSPAVTAKPAGFFTKNWNKIINGKLSGPALKTFGHALGATFVAGEYSKGLMEEMDNAIAQDTDINGGYALVRAWDTGVKEPAYLVADLLGQGIEGGALYLGGKMQDFVDLNQAFYDKASEQGLVEAFGETYVAAMKKRWQEGTLWESTKSGTEWAWNKGAEGLDYAWNHPGKTLDKVDESLYQGTLVTGEFLGVKAVGDLLYRDVQTEVLNDITLRDNAIRAAVILRQRAEGLRALLDTLKRQVRTGDPAKPGVTAGIEDTAQRYATGYGLLKQDYNAFWSRLYRNHGGLQNPAIAKAMDDMKDDLAVVNALPEDPFDFMSDRFIQGLLSKVTVRLSVAPPAEGETTPGNTSGNTSGNTPGNTNGYVQFNAPANNVHKSCRGTMPTLTCGGLPPDNYQVLAKFGDYAEVSGNLVINPLIRRAYQTEFTLNVEAPPGPGSR